MEWILPNDFRKMEEFKLESRFWDPTYTWHPCNCYWETAAPEFCILPWNKWPSPTTLGKQKCLPLRENLQKKPKRSHHQRSKRLNPDFLENPIWTTITRFTSPLFWWKMGFAGHLQGSLQRTYPLLNIRLETLYPPVQVAQNVRTEKLRT